MQPYFKTDTPSKKPKRSARKSRKGVAYMYHKEGIVSKFILR